MEKSYYFIFNDDCFDRDNQRNDIAGEKRTYNKTLYEMNKHVEELDRYDDFDSLKIEADKYAKNDMSGDYGIPYDGTKHINRQVILKHQSAAAIAFLKDLRGFGLLADVVGSGKTFEAALILSELAVRGKIKSMLLVVPGQVYDSWIDVLERQFGLGRGVLFEAASDLKNLYDFGLCGIKTDLQNRPDRPIIVKTEDFVNWDYDLASYLFDVIVVDEAHHLCKEDGEYAKAMKMLSMMMETKKRANSTYCLLLSATPHSGNLEHMFRLWYFIRCKGGNPSDFDEKEDINRTKEYRDEKEYYRERVCRGATTVMEFIKRVKKNEVLLNYSDKLSAYLAERDTNMGQFSTQMTDGQQQMLVDDFLNRNEELNQKVMRSVANAYHNGVLRSIMIRQPSTSLIAKEKALVNYLFYPAKRTGMVQVKDWYNNHLRVNVDAMNDENARSVTVVDENGKALSEAVSFREYVREHHNHLSESRFYMDILCNVFAETVDQSRFEKKDFILYYRDQMVKCPDNKVRCELRPMVNNRGESFDAKMAETKRILRRHAHERILIFFDYELKKTALRHDRFVEEIRKDSEFASRVIVGTAYDKDKTLNAFNEMENAILVVKDPSFTEGVNLQSGSIIINFQVTPDPLAMDQRIGRIFRLGQKNNVTIYSLANMNKLEGFALMYFVRIGLMSSNSGDATIIAGSNNDRMVAVQCERCGMVKLLSLEDYETAKRRGVDGELYCTATSECKNYDRPDGTLMKEISVYDFKCDKCATVFVRSVSDESGYLCVSSNNTGRSIMCSQGDKGDRRLYCRKICAMSHCSRFQPGECPAVEAYQKNKSIGDQDLYTLCIKCPHQDRCPEKCRPYIGTDGISACSDCSYATCSPKPHVIDFDDHWEADCPVCRSMNTTRRGKLRPIVARTFAAYLRASWDFKHDDGRGFCTNLLREANKVTDIKLVLDADRNE